MVRQASHRVFITSFFAHMSVSDSLSLLAYMCLTEYPGSDCMDALPLKEGEMHDIVSTEVGRSFCLMHETRAPSLVFFGRP